MEEKRATYLRGVWEMVKEAVFQRILTWHLPTSTALDPAQFSGLNVIVTGATRGIGLHTARELAMAGAHVVMACRNVEIAKRIAHQWAEEASDGISIQVEAMPLDLLSLSSVHSFAKEWEKRSMPLHVLINNAGAFYMIEKLTKVLWIEPQKRTEDGIEQHMQVNHIAPALLTLLLLPSLLKAQSSRIVNVNSVAHHYAVIDTSHWNRRIDDDKFNSMKAYGESKLAQLIFLKTLAKKLLEKRITSIHCLAVSPGIVNTNMVKQVPIPDWKLFWTLNPAEGARSVLFCVKSPSVLNSLLEGFANYSCACKPAKYSTHASNVESCHNVWKETLELLHLDADYLTQIVDC